MEGKSDFFTQHKPPLHQRKLAPLSDVLAYDNAKVERRFLSLYDVSPTDATELFCETKRFLWACGQCSESLAPIPIIDKMWHNFILFTPDYAGFCQQHFGYYIHHIPADKEFERARDPARFRTRAHEELRRQLSFLCELLGEDVLLRWYVKYALEYDLEFFETHAVVSPSLAISLELLQRHVDSLIKVVSETVSKGASNGP